MTIINAVRRYLSYDLLLPLIIIILNIFYFSPQIVPHHDTFFAFENFYFFYNEFFFSGHLPRWMPYVNYGIPAEQYQFFALGPANYFAMVIGCVFRIEDALWLFKCSLLLEQLIFLGGVYLLSLGLFKDRFIIWYVCLATMASQHIFFQVFFNFRIYYLVPFLLWAISNYFESCDQKWLWVVVFSFLAMLLGNSFYLSLLTGYVFLLLVLCWYPYYKGLIVFKGNSFWVLFLLLVLAGFFLLYVMNSYQDLFLLRRSGGTANSLHTFLTYGGVMDIRILISGLFWGWPLFSPLSIRNDNTLYLGFLGAVFGVYSVFFVRNKYCGGLFCAAVLLIFLSFGGFFARVVYYLPGMSYFRHIGYVYGLVKILLIVCAGFGLQHFLTLAKKRMSRVAVVFLVVCLGLPFLVFVGGQVFPVLFHKLNAHGMFWPWFKVVLLRLGLGAFLAGLVLVILRSSKVRYPLELIKTALLVILIIDVFLMQKAFYAEYPRLGESGAYSSNFFTHKLKFEPSRIESGSGMFHKRQKVAVDLYENYIKGAGYSTVSLWTQVDSCIPQGEVQFLTPGIVSTIAEYQKSGKIAAQEKRRLGCEPFSKVNVFAGVGVLDITRASFDIQGWGRPVWGDEVTSFSSDRLELKVNAGSLPATLVYADAFYSKWRAKVNGKPRKIFPALGGFKAVSLDLGRNLVEFYYYDPFGLMVGWAVFVFGVGVAILGITAFGYAFSARPRKF